MTASNDCINLSLINGKVLCFSSSDYKHLRSKHHFVGKFIGIPICFQRNSLWNGLPVFFSEFEAKLMLEKGLITIRNKTGLEKVPNDLTKKVFADHQEKVITELQQPYVETRLEGIRHNMKHIIRGKRKKLLQMGLKEEEITLTPETIIEDEAARIRQSIGSKSVYTHIQTQHLFRVSTETVSSIPVANEKKYKVFRDLWLKGFFISGGDSFGCDFLTYPGDPMLYHASQIVHVIDKSQQFDAKHLTSCARLSVSVNKKCVFAYVESDESVTYQTLHWDNPKLREIYVNSRPGTKQKVETNDLAGC